MDDWEFKNCPNSLEVPYQCRDVNSNYSDSDERLFGHFARSSLTQCPTVGSVSQISVACEVEASLSTESISTGWLKGSLQEIKSLISNLGEKVSANKKVLSEIQLAKSKLKAA